MSTDGTNRRGIHIAGDAFETLNLAFREQETSDFGIDAHVEPRCGATGTGQLLALQVKAGPSYSREPTDGGWWVRTDKKHADYWLQHALPVILVKVDIATKRVFWQAVTTDTIVSTGAGRKFLIPESQQVDEAAATVLAEFLTPIVPVSRYTVVREKDVSHGFAKRYSLDIVLNGQLSKSEVATVARDATATARGSRYHRNEISRARWEDHEADVVWTFVYPSAEDLARTNWICRSQWIRFDLDQGHKPLNLVGEPIGNGVLVDWKDDYQTIAKLVSARNTDKRGYLDLILPLVEEFGRILNRHGARLDQLSLDAVSLADFLRDTGEDRHRANELYMTSIDLTAAPYECMETGRRFDELAASIDNMVLPHSDKGLDTWSARDGLFNAQQARKHAKEALDSFHYELKKIR